MIRGLMRRLTHRTPQYGTTPALPDVADGSPMGRPHDPNAGVRIAVRPNLNMPGYLTMHIVGPKGGIDYHHATQQTYLCVVLEDVQFHQNAKAARKIHDGAIKFPMASAVGTYVRRQQALDCDGWERVRYDPQARDAQFRTDDNKPVRGARMVQLKWKEMYAQGVIRGRTA